MALLLVFWASDVWFTSQWPFSTPFSTSNCFTAPVIEQGDDEAGLVTEYGCGGGGGGKETERIAGEG